MLKKIITGLNGKENMRVLHNLIVVASFMLNILSFSKFNSLIWLVVCLLSWYACNVTIYSIIQDYVQKPAAITIDTSYLDWRTPFPTTAICSSYNQAAKEFTAA